MEILPNASMGNIEGGKSQIGYVIGLRDERGGRYLLAWKSQIGKKLVKSSKEVEAIGRGEALEVAVFLKEI